MNLLFSVTLGDTEVSLFSDGTWTHVFPPIEDLGIKGQTESGTWQVHDGFLCFRDGESGDWDSAVEEIQCAYDDWMYQLEKEVAAAIVGAPGEAT